MEREIKIDWEDAFLEKLVEKVEMIAKEEGYIKKLDIEPQVDRRILEFQKGEKTFSISLDFYESRRSFFILKGDKKAVDIFFKGVRIFIKEILETLKSSFKSKDEIEEFKRIIEDLKEFF